MQSTSRPDPAPTNPTQGKQGDREDPIRPVPSRHGDLTPTNPTRKAIPVTTFDTTIHTASGNSVWVTVHNGSTMADLIVTGQSDTVAVCLGYRALGLLASGLAAVVHGQLGDTVDVKTEAGVMTIEQPSGLVAITPVRGDASLTVDNHDGHFVDSPLTAEESARLSVAFSAAANQL